MKIPTKHRGHGSKSDGSEVTEVTPPGNTATFTRVAVLLLLTTTCLVRGYDDARVTPPHRHVRIGKRGQGITSNCHPGLNHAASRDTFFERRSSGETAVDNSFFCVRAQCNPIIAVLPRS